MKKQFAVIFTVLSLVIVGYFVSDHYARSATGLSGTPPNTGLSGQTTGGGGGDDPGSTNGTMNHVINVKDDFGATGDTQDAWDGTMTAGSNAFHSETVTFTGADVGKQMIVDGAAVNGGALITIITNYLGPHDVTLQAAAAVSTPYGTPQNYRNTTVGGGDGDRDVTASYTPGDIIVMNNATGSVTTQAQATVAYTGISPTVANISIINAGHGGVYWDGGTSTPTASGPSCQVIGTTGTALGRNFILNVKLTGGAISEITSVSRQGTYSANPDDPTNEPVTTTDLDTGCRSLVGAIVSVKMIGVILYPTAVNAVYPGAIGTYPTSFTQDPSSTTTGAGQVFFPTYMDQGQFHYGTDDTTAWEAAVNAAIAAQTAELNNPCIYVPPGIYFIRRPMPTFYGVNGCILGAGVERAWMYMSPEMNGDLFSWSEDWQGGLHNRTGFVPATYSGQSMVMTANSNGPKVRDISIRGDRLTQFNQNALTLYDRHDNVEFQNIDIWYVNGSGIASGIRLNAIASYLRESHFDNIRIQNCGNPTHACFDFNSDALISGDSINEMHVTNLNIYDPNGIGLYLRGTGIGNPRSFKLSGVRVEGHPFGGASENMTHGGRGDLIRVGDPDQISGLTTGINFDQVELINHPPESAAIHLDPGGTVDLTNCNFDNVNIVNGWGSGIKITRGRNNRFKILSMFTLDYNVIFGPLAGGFNEITGISKSEQNFTYDVTTASQLYTTGAIMNGVPQGRAAYITAFANDNQIYHGGLRGSGSVDLNLTKFSATNIAAAPRSAMIAGQTNTIVVDGFYSGIVGGLDNTLSGPGSGILGQFGCNDFGRRGLQCWSGGSLNTSSGGAQAGRQVLSGTTSTGTAVQLTSDKLTAGTTNTVNMPNLARNTVFTAGIRLSAVVRTIANVTLATTAAAASGTDLTFASTTGVLPRMSVANGAIVNLTSTEDVTIGNSVLTFASVPASVVVGMAVTDTTTAHVTGIQANTTVASKTATTITLNQPTAGTGVFSGDTIHMTRAASVSGAHVVSVTATTVTLDQAIASPGVLSGDSISFNGFGSTTVNAGTVAGNAVLHFPAVPAYVVPGALALDRTKPSAITSSQYVLAADATTVTLSAGVDADVVDTNVIDFLPASYSWTLPTLSMVQGVTQGSLRIFAGTPVTNSTGLTAGLAVAVTADNTLGALNLTFTPPTANTDTWDVSATVDTQEIM